MRRAALAYGAALLAATVVFLLFPGLDLWTSALFYRAEGGFFLANWGPVRFLYRAVPYITDAAVIGVVALYLLTLLRGSPLWRIDGRAAAYLLLALALGPGLLVNTVLKDHWGRARPAQVSEFGGTQQFTPAPLPADQCARNCSFPAGHPAIGFYLIAFAFLVPERRQRRLAGAAAVAAGALIGLARMAQGGHFLSDVVFSGLLVCGLCRLLHRVTVADDRLARWAGTVAPPRWLAVPALALLALLLLLVAFVDRPVARLLHDGNPAVHELFQFITQFGLGKGYLVISGLLFIALRLAARRASERELAQRLALNAYRALFVFFAAAVPGLVADVLKILFGRARPKLLFAEDVYGFSWGALRSDHWSFPSGHATTIVALAVALALLWPRGRAAYALVALLVMASRPIIGAHYVSDVIAGAALGAGVVWAMWQAFARLGLPLDRGVAQPAPEPVRAAER